MIERRTLADGSVRWKARVKSQGKVIAQKTFPRKADAETWEREQYRALTLGAFVSPQLGKTPVHDVIVRFLEAREGQVSEHAHRTDRDNLASLPPSLRNRPIAAVTQADVLDALTVLLATRAHSTVSRTRTSLSALFTWAARERYLSPSAHPVHGVRMPSGALQSQSVEWFTPNDVHDLICAHSALSPHYALVTEWLALTGQRWSEARALRVRDVQDLPHPAVRIYRAQSDGYREKRPKTRRGIRAVPLVERARAIAAVFAAGKNPDDYLLTTITGKQLRATLYRRYTKWTATARGRHVHHLRHFAASEWLRRGVPLNQVAAWLGDDPRTVLQVYAHVMGEQQDREALALLNRAANPGPPRDPRETDQALRPLTKKGGRA